MYVLKDLEIYNIVKGYICFMLTSFLWAAGRLTKKVLPDAKSLITLICPPIKFINSLIIDKPKSVPSLLLPGIIKLRSNILGMYCGTIPRPLS